LEVIYTVKHKNAHQNVSIVTWRWFNRF